LEQEIEMATGSVTKSWEGGRTVIRRPPVSVVADCLQEARRVEETQAGNRPVCAKLMSFGFKYGLPHANYYFDVAFIKNPAREAEWGFFSEPTEEMRQYVLGQEQAREFIARIEPLLVFLSSLDQNQVFAFGCNSGRHRSCVLVEELARRLEKAGIKTNVTHRDRGY
jgi:UPF0042 nucleotide-binding protein